jgi:transcriptional antiterminator
MLNQNQKAAIRAFLSEKPRTVAEVARETGVTERTIYNYLEDPEFQAALNQKQAAITTLAILRLGRLAEKALDGLEKVMDNPDMAGATNLRLAAKDVLKLLATFTDQEIENRLARLEREIFS